jgi:hypothetical protein
MKDIMRRTSQYYVASKATRGVPVPATPGCGLKEWCLVISSIIIGLLALFFLVSQGGIFAYVAPWVILGGTLALTKRPGWQAVGLLTGAAFFYLGVAALFPANHHHGQHIACAVLGLLGGPGFIAITLFEMRKRARTARIAR